MSLTNKIVESSEKVISKHKKLAIHFGLFILFLSILMCLTYIEVVYFDEISSFLVKYFNGGVIYV